MIFGKILAGLIGYAWLGPLGGIVGVFVGHQFDKALAKNLATVSSADQAIIQQAFFRTTFILMGKMAKADGQVSQNEIKWAEHVMARMQLNPEMRKQAIDLFGQGKSDSLDLEAELKDFKRHVGRHANLIQMFLEIQIQAGYADGNLSQPEIALLQKVCATLGISAFRFEVIHQRIKAERAFAKSNYQQYGGGQPQYSEAEKLKEAYSLLGVDAGVSDSELKKAYRRLMNQHHPDKLVAKGLPEEMMEIAKEKTQEIQAAYEMVSQNRKNNR